MRYVLMVVLMALTCLDLRLAHAMNEIQRGSLKGLPGVSVVIEDIDKEAQVDGLSKDTIRTAVELILRSSGIQVLTQAESIAIMSEPWLYVKTFTVKNKNGVYGYHIAVSLMQRVSLLASPSLPMIGSTWEQGAGGTVGALDIRTIVVDAEEIVKAFANDFLAVNPR